MCFNTNNFFFFVFTDKSYCVTKIYSLKCITKYCAF